jgi:hypothetical protein
MTLTFSELRHRMAHAAVTGLMLLQTASHTVAPVLDYLSVAAEATSELAVLVAVLKAVQG